MVKATFALAKPAEAEATIRLTMTIAEWKALRAEVDEQAQWHTPAGKLRSAIRDLVNMAEKHFEAETEARFP